MKIYVPKFSSEPDKLISFDCIVPALYPSACLSIQKVYNKITIGIAYVFLNTHGTHKVYLRYTQGIHKVAGDTCPVITQNTPDHFLSMIIFVLNSCDPIMQAI